MRFLCLLLSFAALSAQAARNIEAIQLEGLSMPFFDPAGRLTHKLTAKTASARGEDRVLHDAEVVYFARDDSTRVIQRITTAEAVYSEAKGTLTGSGPIRVVTDASQLSGVGFDFSLGTSALNLHREVRMQDREFVLTGDQATAELIVEKSGDKLKYRDIRRARFTGNLHLVTLDPGEKIHVEEAFTNVAVYDGLTRRITMPEEVREIIRDEKGRRGESTSRTGFIQLSSE